MRGARGSIVRYDATSSRAVVRRVLSRPVASRAFAQNVSSRALSRDARKPSLSAIAEHVRGRDGAVD